MSSGRRAPKRRNASKTNVKISSYKSLIELIQYYLAPIVRLEQFVITGTKSSPFSDLDHVRAWRDALETARIERKVTVTPVEFRLHFLRTHDHVGTKRCFTCRFPQFFFACDGAPALRNAAKRNCIFSRLMSGVTGKIERYVVYMYQYLCLGHAKGSNGWFLWEVYRIDLVPNISELCPTEASTTQLNRISKYNDMLWVHLAKFQTT